MPLLQAGFRPKLLVRNRNGLQSLDQKRFPQASSLPLSNKLILLLNEMYRPDLGNRWLWDVRSMSTTSRGIEQIQSLPSQVEKLGMFFDSSDLTLKVVLGERKAL
jgi:hypothetical protein